MLIERAVYCTAAMQTFGKRMAKVLDAPLFVDTFCGDVDTVHIIGMYDLPDFTSTLENTARAKRRIIHWCGSDVQYLRDASKLPEAVHITESENLRRELFEKGVEATTITFPTEIHVAPTPFPEENKIAVYAGSDGHKYGLSIVQALSLCLPEWKFTVYGLGAFNKPKMEELIKTHKLYLRLTKHDGSMNSAREFLEAGRYTLTTGEIPYTKQVPRDDLNVLTATIRKYEKVTELNMEAHEYYKEFNSEERFLNELKGAGLYE